MCCFRLRLSFLVSREETLQVYRISKGRGVAFKLVKFAFLKFGRGGFVENRARWKYLGYVYNNEISLRDWGWFAG